ncbi:DNA-packaging protein [Domibacillus antri]|uniref:DNA-packaging protein n=1 Tax=Domibacillus antri TaxID=1714264 RepID=A0A1Q8Q3M2_9BACI|nr:head-tail connector protein [Domibacillus antri]OLN21902.1 DNA-packaging protein [Domibacillus antri]
MLLDDIKLSLRISHTALDGEINDLIASARQDLKVSGVSALKVDETVDVDPLIKRAIITYCKANFTADNADSERFQKSYDLLKMHLSLAGDYK